MLKKISFYKRKSKGLLKFFFLCFLIFLLVFLICFGVWIFLKNHNGLYSPLAKVILHQKDLTVDKIESICFLKHLNCTNILINNDNTVSLTLDTNEEIVLSLNKDLLLQLSSLQLTRDHLTIEGKRLRRADFRFDKPVIEY